MNKERRKAFRYFSKNLGHIKQEKKRCISRAGGWENTITGYSGRGRVLTSHDQQGALQRSGSAHLSALAGDGRTRRAPPGWCPPPRSASLSRRCGSCSHCQHGTGMQHRRRCSAPAAAARQRPAAWDADIKYLSGLSLLCLSFVGETKRQLAGSTETFRLKCPRKLAGRLCLLNTVLRLTVPSAAPLPWGGAGSAPHELLAALFWNKRNFHPHAPKCFQKICVLISRTVSLTKTLRW